MAVSTDVTNTVASTASTAAGKASEEASVNFDTFITLLSVQLQNQDPLNPMDGTAFTEQIATFSSLEQQIATNKYLEDMASRTDMTAQSLAVSYIGKDAMVEGDFIELKGDTESFAIALGDNAQTAVLEIVNEDGEVVRTVNLEHKSEGVQYFTWDGQNDDAEELPDGLYTLRVSAYRKDETKVPVEIYTYGRVVAVEGDASNVVVKLADGREAPIAEVYGVKEASQSNIFVDDDNNTEGTDDAAAGDDTANNDDTSNTADAA